MHSLSKSINAHNMSMIRELREFAVKGNLVDMAVDQIDRFLTTTPSPLAIAPPRDWDGADEWRARL